MPQARPATPPVQPAPVKPEEVRFIRDTVKRFYGENAIVRSYGPDPKRLLLHVETDIEPGMEQHDCLGVQVSLTDPDARSMATSGRGSGIVGNNVQSVVEAEHHLIVAHDVITTGSDRQQLTAMSQKAQAAMGVDGLEMLADRGYFSGEEIVASEAIGVMPYVPKPLTSNAKAEGRFGKQDFTYMADQDVYRCPAGALLPHHMTTVEKGLVLHRYWDRASCQACALKPQCTPSIERRVTRWEHEAVIEAMQRRMDLAPQSPMKLRRRIVEHPFGTIKAWMGHTHFLMKRLPNVKTEISLHILAYNLKRVMQILGTGPLIAAMRA